MKSSTYGFFVMLGFLGALGEKYDTISDLIKIADSIAMDMGCISNLQYMTKYNVIKDLEKEGLIIFHKQGHGRVILKAKVKNFVLDWSLDAVDEVKNE